MNRKKLISLIIAICMIVLTGCIKDTKTAEVENQSDVIEVEKANEDSNDLVDDSKLYEMEKRDTVSTFYITISDNNDTSFYELDNWYGIHNSDTNAPKLDIIIQEGTENGIKKGAIGYNDSSPNASIELRGKSTRVATQKSFKIDLFDSTGLWKGQKTLNLNKHPYDPLRIRNKLSFDYFTKISNMTSMRTQFVHLYINDLTNKDSKGKFVDYGLYTHVEQGNERFLATHGLDSNGSLYKATNFEFYRYADQIKLETDPSFNKSEFEQRLEIKGNNDHQKLIEMLGDVNNYGLDINKIVDKHFDRENYLTWIASNILMGNQDVTTQNFYLYSPSNSDTWYFLPWDYDGAWKTSSTIGVYPELADWEKGLSNYWGSVLHKRFFKDPKNIIALSNKIEELTKIINPEQTKNFLDDYYPVVNKFIRKSPDKNYLGINVSDYKKAYFEITKESELNKDIYYQNLEKPMPFFLNYVKERNNQHTFEWDPSYDIQGNDISYTFQLSKDPSFSNMIIENKNLTATVERVNHLAKGPYFLRVIAKDSKGNQRLGFDVYEDDEGKKYFGVMKIVVN